MNQKHTPSRLEVSKVNPCGCGIAYQETTGRDEDVLVYCAKHGAAPELLEALKDIEAWYRQGGSPLDPSAEIGAKDGVTILQAIRAAIAKAEGR